MTYLAPESIADQGMRESAPLSYSSINDTASFI